MKLALPAFALLLTFAATAIAADPPKTVPEADAKAKVDALKTAMKGTDANAKMAAIDACGSAPHPLTAAALAPLLGDASDDIRAAAAAALGKMARLPDAAKALHAGLPGNESKSPVVKAIFSAMEAVGLDVSVPVAADWVTKHMSKKEEAIVATVDAAFVCLGGLKFKDTVKQLIDIQKKAEVAGGGGGTRGAATTPPDKRPSDALANLTGQKFTKSSEWDAWWKKTEPTLNDDLSPKKK